MSTVRAGMEIRPAFGTGRTRGNRLGHCLAAPGALYRRLVRCSKTAPSRPVLIHLPPSGAYPLRQIATVLVSALLVFLAHDLLIADPWLTLTPTDAAMRRDLCYNLYGE